MNLYYKSDNNYLFINGKEIVKFKSDNKNVNFQALYCLGIISDEFSATESRDIFFIWKYV